MSSRSTKVSSLPYHPASRRRHGRGRMTAERPQMRDRHEDQSRGTRPLLTLSRRLLLRGLQLEIRTPIRPGRLGTRSYRLDPIWAPREPLPTRYIRPRREWSRKHLGKGILHRGCRARRECHGCCQGSGGEHGFPTRFPAASLSVKSRFQGQVGKLTV
jgi:hypothetical protein